VVAGPGLIENAGPVTVGETKMPRCIPVQCRLKLRVSHYVKRPFPRRPMLHINITMFLPFERYRYGLGLKLQGLHKYSEYQASKAADVHQSFSLTLTSTSYEDEHSL